jgi:hypothetical protein
MSLLIEHPATDEYASWAADYVRRAGDGDILATLSRQVDEFPQALMGLSDQDGLFRFAPQEWSIKEVIGHICDFERIFFYRALCLSRNEKAPLPSFEQDPYVRETNFNGRSLGDLIQEFELLRHANLLSLKYLNAEAGLRRGTVGHSQFSARALVYCMAGHVYYHMNDLQTLYLPGFKK